MNRENERENPTGPAAANGAAANNGNSGHGADGDAHMSDSADWKPCPQGAVDQVVRGVRARQSRRRAATALRAGGTIAAVLMAAGITYWAWPANNNAGNPPATVPDATVPDELIQRVSCSEVRDRMDEYLAGRLDVTLQNRIDTHMKRCPKCQEAIPADREDNRTVAMDHRMQPRRQDV